VLSGFAACSFEAAELLFVAADLGGDGFQAAAQLVERISVTVLRRWLESATPAQAPLDTTPLLQG
jgi:hypothetical protein